MRRRHALNCARLTYATQSQQALCIKLGTIGLTEHSRHRRCSRGWQLGLVRIAPTLLDYTAERSVHCSLVSCVLLDL